MVNAQQWLNKKYKEKSEITELDISNINLESDLDLTDFANLKEVNITGNPKLGKINKRREVKVIITNPQELLNREYPEDGVCRGEIDLENKDKRREEITKLSLGERNLEGSLELTGFSKLTELIVHKNKLTNIDLSNCPKLEILDCSYNELTNLNIDECSKLNKLNCSYNSLDSLDFLKLPHSERLIFLNIDNCGCEVFLSQEEIEKKLTSLKISLGLVKFTSYIGHKEDKKNESSGIVLGSTKSFIGKDNNNKETAKELIKEIKNKEESIKAIKDDEQKRKTDDLEKVEKELSKARKKLNSLTKELIEEAKNLEKSIGEDKNEQKESENPKEKLLEIRNILGFMPIAVDIIINSDNPSGIIINTSPDNSVVDSLEDRTTLNVENSEEKEKLESLKELRQQILNNQKVYETEPILKFERLQAAQKSLSYPFREAAQNEQEIKNKSFDELKNDFYNLWKDGNRKYKLLDLDKIRLTIISLKNKLPEKSDLVEKERKDEIEKRLGKEGEIWQLESSKDIKKKLKEEFNKIYSKDSKRYTQKQVDKMESILNELEEDLDDDLKKAKGEIDDIVNEINELKENLKQEHKDWKKYFKFESVEGLESLNEEVHKKWRKLKVYNYDYSLKEDVKNLIEEVYNIKDKKVEDYFEYHMKSERKMESFSWSDFINKEPKFIVDSILFYREVYEEKNKIKKLKEDLSESEKKIKEKYNNEEYQDIPNSRWAWNEYNKNKFNEAEELYNKLKEKNSTFVRLQNINYYGSKNAELYMLYAHTLRNEIPEYIEKVKEELGTKFVRFNEKFKKAKGESFGDFVVKKISNSDDFYFSPDRVWREIESAKEEVLRQILDMAPSMEKKETDLCRICDKEKVDEKFFRGSCDSCCEKYKEYQVIKKEIKKWIDDYDTDRTQNKDEVKKTRDILQEWKTKVATDPTETSYEWKLVAKWRSKIDEVISVLNENRRSTPLPKDNNSLSNKVSNKMAELKELLKQEYYSMDGNIQYQVKEELKIISEVDKLPTRLYNIEEGRKKVDETEVVKLMKDVEETEGRTDIKSYATTSYSCGELGDPEKGHFYPAARKTFNKAFKALEIINKRKNEEIKKKQPSISEEELKKTDIKYLWVDQLCIKQEGKKGVEDKAIEMPRMRQYYGNSAVTLISINRKLCKDDGTLPSLPEALKEIINSNWFTRTWTFQEGWLSKQTIFMFDDCLVDGRAIAQAWVLNQPVYTKFAKYSSIDEAAEGSKKIATPVGWVYYKSKDGEWYDSDDKVDFGLGQILKEIKYRERGHAVDSIYALLGLLPYGEKVIASRYKADRNEYTEYDVKGALFDVIKVAIENGYGEPLSWHGEGSDLMPKVIDFENEDKIPRGSVNARGGLVLVCKCEQPHKSCETCSQGSYEKHNHDFYGCVEIKDVERENNGTIIYGDIEIKGLKYTIESVSSEMFGIEANKGFLIEGGLYKKSVKVEEGNDLNLIGSQKTLESIKKNDLLIILDKDKWESESPFAILVGRINDNSYFRKGIVGFDGKSEARKLERLEVKKENLIVKNNYSIQIAAIEEVEKRLKKSKLSESILENNWRDKLLYIEKGIDTKKIKEEIKKEKEKLLNLAEQAESEYWFKTITSLKPSEDWEFVLWLKNKKELTAKQVLENYQLAELKKEYQKLETKIEVNPSQK